MAYQATVLPVMIASPSDVPQERKIVREVLHEWNDIHALREKVILAPTAWETHSSPELGARPQELINNRLLKHCDILIGVFWTRIGTPTGEQASGTVEEILRHAEEGKPALVYFSSAPVAPESLDIAQWTEVQSFRKKCELLGIIEKYASLDDFRTKLHRQIQISLASSEYIKGLIGSAKASPEEAAPKVSLSEWAARLLSAAAKDDGVILSVERMDGYSIQIGGFNFDGKDPRRGARLKAALQELLSLGFITSSDSAGIVYDLTHLGWEAADSLPS